MEWRDAVDWSLLSRSLASAVAASAAEAAPAAAAAATAEAAAVVAVGRNELQLVSSAHPTNGREKQREEAEQAEQHRSISQPLLLSRSIADSARSSAFVSSTDLENELSLHALVHVR